MLPRIAITMGDPAGIGPEVILKSLAKSSVRRAGQFLIVGHETVLAAARARLGLRCVWTRIEAGDVLFGRGIRLLEPCPMPGAVPRPGRWTVKTGRMSVAYVTTAIQLCSDEVADAMVTGPICKAAWKAAGAHWPGHTELLAEKTGTKDFVMMLAGGGLRVALVTIHEPLARVPRLVTKEKIVATTRVVASDLKRRFGLSNPRIAVLGLNPHAGEAGHIGSEEETVIRPAIKALRRMRIKAVGPLPADTVFHHARQGAFDAVVAMYHDQGLGPLKTVAFDSGVNITLGLPIVRTSVDHGTAFDIAGSGVAHETSCVAAIRTAISMCTA